jgi:hypothetical protein
MRFDTAIGCQRSNQWRPYRCCAAHGRALECEGHGLHDRRNNDVSVGKVERIGCMVLYHPKKHVYDQVRFLLFGLQGNWGERSVVLLQLPKMLQFRGWAGVHRLPRLQREVQGMVWMAMSKVSRKRRPCYANLQ